MPSHLKPPSREKNKNYFLSFDTPDFSFFCKRKKSMAFEPATSHFFGKFFLFLKVFFLLRKKSLLQSARATTAPRAHFWFVLQDLENYRFVNLNFAAKRSLRP